MKDFKKFEMHEKTETTTDINATPPSSGEQREIWREMLMKYLKGRGFMDDLIPGLEKEYTITRKQ